MSKKQITVSVVNKGSNPLPTFTKEGDACVDLRADFTNGFNDDLGAGAAWDNVSKCVRLFSGGRCVIPTGLYTAFDPNFKLEIVPRSGLAIKHGITVLNTPGTVDAKLINITSSRHFKYSNIIHKGHLNSSFKELAIYHKNGILIDEYIYDSYYPNLDTESAGRITVHRYTVWKNYDKFNPIFFTFDNLIVRLKDKILIHHIDCDHTNNDINNLISPNKKTTYFCT